MGSWRVALGQDADTEWRFDQGLHRSNPACNRLRQDPGRFPAPIPLIQMGVGPVDGGGGDAVDHEWGDVGMKVQRHDDG